MINFPPVSSAEWPWFILCLLLKTLFLPLFMTFWLIGVYLQLARRGFNIVLISRTQQKLDDLSKAICEHLHDFWSTASVSSFFSSQKLKCVYVFCYKSIKSEIITHYRLSRQKLVWMMLRITQLIRSWLHDWILYSKNNSAFACVCAFSK